MGASAIAREPFVATNMRLKLLHARRDVEVCVSLCHTASLELVKYTASRVFEEFRTLQVGRRISTSKQICSSIIGHKTRQLKFSNSFIIPIIFCSLLMSVASAHSFGKDECDPNDVNSCSFGATCQKEHVRGHRGRAYYRCKCPQISCYSAGLYDPVCGDDGIFEKPFYNVLCLMLQECEMQKPIQQVCYGICGTSSCRKISPESMHHGPCPREDANLCLNGGLCVHHKIFNRSSCRCPSQYTGDRCESKVLPPPKANPTHDEDGENCDSSKNFLTIFAIVLLGLVLLSIIVCLCWRNRRGGKQEDDFWPNRLDQEETTPLRESTRSDYLFPPNDTEKSKNSEK